jgi:hypothetical protein
MRRLFIAWKGRKMNIAVWKGVHKEKHSEDSIKTALRPQISVPCRHRLFVIIYTSVVVCKIHLTNLWSLCEDMWI